MNVAALNHALLAAPWNTNGSTSAVLLVLMVVVLAVLMVATHRRVRRSQYGAGQTSIRDRYESFKNETAAKHSLEQVMLELDQLARQIHGKLDTRLARLDALIRDADERIERWNRLHAIGIPEQSTGRLDVTIDDKLRNSSDEASEVASHAHAPVWRLADAGMSEPQIARELDKPIGEVQLILSLRRARAGATGSASSLPQEAAEVAENGTKSMLKRHQAKGNIVSG